MSTDEKKGFAEWALVELMGHQRIVGYVTEQTIGGSAMLRVDVPDKDGATRFTRFYGSSAIYAINPVTKEVALQLAGSVDATPVKAYQLPARAEDEALRETIVAALVEHGESLLDDDGVDESAAREIANNITNRL